VKPDLGGGQLLRKTIVLLVVGAVAVAALAAVPGPAVGKRICSKGHPHNSLYCSNQCVVPRVVGRHLNRAKQMIRAAGCRVGKITRQDKDKKCEKGKTKCTTAAARRWRHREHGYEKGIVVRQRPRGGAGSKCQPGVGPTSQCLPQGTKVNLKVEF
jgi:hypothetical protein